MNEGIRKWALKNAVEYNGKANPGAVISKILAEKPEMKKNIKKHIAEIQKICSEVNRLSQEEQRKELETIAPELLEKKEAKSEEYQLPKLPNAKKGKVITAFPPEPSKYLHLGHAKGSIINHEFARKYSGKFLLRFEDTNPQKVEMKYYGAIIEDLEWLGIKIDKKYYMSDHFDEYFKYMRKLIEEGNAYVCTCSSEIVSQNRRAKRECICRNMPEKEQLHRWEMMFSEFRSGDAILRLKGNMKSNDTAIRDPSLARIIDKIHPRTKKNHKVYPNYDLPASVEDSKITHRVRSKEFEARKGVQKLIRKYLGLKHPWIYEQARFTIKGSTTSGRVLRELISEGKVTGWDDPRLLTIRALKRRGITPEAIREFVISTGLSNSESTLSWDVLFTINRKIIDKEANRYFFAPDPVELTVKNAKNEEFKLKIHPEGKKYRTLKTDGSFYIAGSDAKKLKKGDIIRLKDAYNIEITKTGKKIEAILAEGGKNLQKIQWVPKDYAVETRVLVGEELFDGSDFRKDSLKTIVGFAEDNVKSVKDGEIVQFERFGFCKKEKNGFIFTHN